MIKKFSTREDKWFYVFALISHIFNFFAESKILFFYYIDDYQKDYLFCWFYRIILFNFQIIFFFFLFIFIIIFFSFSCFFFFFSSFNYSLLFLLFSVFVDRLNLAFRCLSWFVRSSKDQKIFLFFFFLFFFLFFFFFDVSSY